MNTNEQNQYNLSEIFPIQVEQAKYWQFQITPEVDRSAGNRISWRLNQKFSCFIIVFDASHKVFWVLQRPNQNDHPSQLSFQEVLDQIVKDLQDDLGDTKRQIINFRPTNPPHAYVISQIAVQILNSVKILDLGVLHFQNNVKVETTIDFWAETVEFNDISNPAIAIQLRTQIVYDGNLQDFINSYSDRTDIIEKISQSLKVKPIGNSGQATIKELVGEIKEYRSHLLLKVTDAKVKKRIESAQDKDLVFRVQFGKSSALYDYPANALVPVITAMTAHLFKANYGELLKATKISYEERKNLIIEINKIIKNFLKDYGFTLNKSLNSQSQSNLFIQGENDIESTELLFGNGFVSTRNKTLIGLRKGGVYKTNSMLNSDNIIRLAILKPEGLTITPLRKSIEGRINQFGFSFQLPPELRKNYLVKNRNKAQIKNSIENIINNLQGAPTDLALIFLPGSQEEDQDDEFYESAKRCLNQLRENVASQIIYEKTVSTNQNNFNNIANNIVPGILAKLGNIPYVLKDPLVIADMFVGLDVSRFRNINKSGSRNVCASVRLYGKQGEFQGYRFYDTLIEGEEIPQKALEMFFPTKDFSNKRILVYRDGRFRGQEIRALTERAKLLNAEFILVESVKSQVPRLYNSNSFEDEETGKKVTQLLPSPKGLALKLSDREVILVTTNVTEKIGVPRPLRLRIHEAGSQANLLDLIDATLKLTLLHYGSLKDPRLPIPLYASDAIAYRRLQGTAPRHDDGDRQFWL